MKIYTIADPNTNEIRYIGVTLQPLKTRLSQHMWDSRNKHRHVCHWIASLGETPLIEALEEVGDDWEEREIYWISQFKAWGFNLTNQHEGGKGVIPTTKPNTKKQRALDVYDVQGKFITSYASGKEMADKLAMSRTSISNALQRDHATLLVDKYRIAYKGEPLKSFTLYKSADIVVSSLRQLCNKLNVCRTKVAKSLNGVNMCQYGKHVIYKDIVWPS